MPVKLHYHPQDILLNTSDLNSNVITLPDVKRSDQQKVLNEGFEEASKSWKKFIANAESLLVIVNDRKRATPTSKVLDAIIDDLPEDTIFVVALGTHHKPDEEELREIFGEYLEEQRENIRTSRAQEVDIVNLFDSQDGFSFKVNRIIDEFDKILTINSVEPHYFAGFTGGRKSFLPGISGYETIVENHKYSLQESAKPLKLKGNPVNENMMELSNYIVEQKDVFSVQLVLDAEQRIYKAYMGNLNASFFKAVEEARNLYSVDVPGKADIVITVAPPPFNHVFTSSFKALDTGTLCLKDDGIIILVASAHKGLGDDERYERISEYQEPAELLNDPQNTSLEEYELGQQRLNRLAMWGEGGNMWTVTHLKKDHAQDMFFKPFERLSEALSEALNEKGNDASVYILPDGLYTFPTIKE